MPFTPPNKILVKTDENILTFIETVTVNKEKLYKYKFTKSISKKGTTMELNELQLEKYLKNGTFKIVE